MKSLNGDEMGLKSVKVTHFFSALVFFSVVRYERLLTWRCTRHRPAYKEQHSSQHKYEAKDAGGTVSNNKSMIVSIGMATIAALDETVRSAREASCRELILLNCTSTYPETPENSHVHTIPHKRQLFGCEAGLSNHIIGVGVAVATVTLGASVIKKHFTLAPG